MYWKNTIHLFMLTLLSTAFAQQQNGNQTILQLLNNTNSSPALKFVQLLQSSADYQPILDLLSSSSSNMTVFVPSDDAFNAIGMMNSTGMGNMSSTGNSNSSEFSPDGPVGVYFSSLLFGQSNPTPASMQASSTMMSSQTQASSSAAASPTGSSPGASNSGTGDETSVEISSFIQPFLPQATNLANALPNLAKYIRRADSELFGYSDVNNLADQGPANGTSNTSLVSQFNMLDILYYHVINQSIALDNSTMVFNTLLTNSSIDKLGYGLPILIQQSQQPQQSPQSPQSPQPPQPPQPPQSSQVQQIDNQLQWIQKRQQMPNETSSNGTFGNGQPNDPASFMWTVGTGVENNTAFIANQSFQASNGAVYIIDKILLPPLSPNQTISELLNASSFDSLLGQTSNNSLDTYSNITLFVPVNQALQNVNTTGLDSQSLNQIIQAHIVPGVYYSTNLTSEPAVVNSLAGTSVSLTNTNSSSNNSMQVNGTNIVHANILLNNGVMHLIDGVLNSTSPQSTSNNTNGDSTTGTDGVTPSTTDVGESSTSTGGSPTSTGGNPDGVFGSLAIKNYSIFHSFTAISIVLILLSYVLL